MEYINYQPTGEPLRFVSHTTSPEIDFTSIHQQSLTESTLLRTDITDLETSYREGLAAALMNRDGEVVAYARFSHLLDASKKEKLGLAPDFPDILEFGTAIIDKAYRGGGLYFQFKAQVLQLIREKIDEQKVLVIGTTKSFAVFQTTRHLQDIGIPFVNTTHTRFPMLAPFTCTCNPDFGSGFHRGTECAKRSTQEQLIDVESIAARRHAGELVSSQSIACVMSVSDPVLAQYMNDWLALSFSQINPEDPQAALVDALVAHEHYT